ncbi:hypothetical protein N7509_013987 [Penicillium cosmopolitanum]|uniref:Zn(2)-C6 fungal-type domain-containing protein n=1 Tax=Penicillium cosmopolitanum TaxID=1131564 RepID=A0A9W9SEF8_9EURO|nr:uncharacterized protein N7509_013987 [Penicillium cosmopolitanum]KAJ5377101.1 hypothetical protein N7509_013987 [Penicillium cosmopolitanum]
MRHSTTNTKAKMLEMGGIPWQSKGCNCRRRKVKCDERRPECERCVKRRIKCQGWKSHSNEIGAPSIVEFKRQKSLTIAVKPTGPAQYPILPVTVYPEPAMRDQVFASFIQRYFPSKNSPSTLRSEEFLGSMVDRAVSAISCLFLGKTNRDTPIFQHGVQLYNSAMRQVSNMIRQGILTNEILYTVAIFQEINALYKALYAPNGLSALGTHVAGMNTLLEYLRVKEQSDPIIDAIHHYQQKFNIPTNGDPLLEILGAYADRIPRAMPYCFQRSMRLSCCKIALFAMCIVSLNYVDSGNREKHEWCREVIRHIAGCGFDIATHLYEMTGYQWRRRWVAADPLTCISLRQTNSLVCSSNLEVLSKIKECRAENASIHYGDELVLGRRPTVD